MRLTHQWEFVVDLLDWLFQSHTSANLHLYLFIPSLLVFILFTYIKIYKLNDKKRSTCSIRSFHFALFSILERFIFLPHFLIWRWAVQLCLLWFIHLEYPLASSTQFNLSLYILLTFTFSIKTLNLQLMQIQVNIVVFKVIRVEILLKYIIINF